MYGPFVCMFVDPARRTMEPIMWRDSSNRMPDAASVNGVGADNHMWQALDADKQVELLQLAATNVAAKNGIVSLPPSPPMASPEPRVRARRRTPPTSASPRSSSK